jgi:hypothetical protein
MTLLDKIGHQNWFSVGRNKLAQFRQNLNKTMPELRKLVPAYEVTAPCSPLPAQKAGPGNDCPVF